MFTAAFWNVNDKPDLERWIAGLAKEARDRAGQSPILVGLTEAKKVDEALLKGYLPSNWTVARSTVESKIVYIHSDEYNFRVLQQTKDGIALSFSPDFHPHEQWIVWIVHLPAPVGEDPQIYSAQIGTMFRMKVEALESLFATGNTFAIGDFNTDPYGAGMTTALGLNAVMCRNVARRESRTVRSEDISYFYNPMWSSFGDQTQQNQPGSFYASHRKTNAAYWHMLDQVLLRAPIIPFLSQYGARVVTSIDGTSLLSPHGVINGQFSDHLPIEVQFSGAHP